jgi:FAD-dependent urate hydroxylase
MDRMGYADTAGGRLTEFSLEPLYEAVGRRAWPLARADLQDILVGAVGVERIRFGACCAAVEPVDAGAVITLADGSRFECDLVIAADGTHSRLRGWVAGEPVDRQYVGYVNYNAVLDDPGDLVAPNTWTTWVGEGRRASLMPCGRGRLYAFCDVPMPLSDANGTEVGSDQELAKAFDGWGPPVIRLLHAMDGTSVNRVAIHDLPPVPRWSRGPVVLLGDSAHTMAPDLGQGGCQALEDALVLALHLVTNDRSVPDALARYEAERAPRTAEIVRRARKRSDITHAIEPAATEEWYRSLSRNDGEGIIAGLVESVVTGPLR